MDNRKISEQELEQVIGGMANSEAGMSEEQARKIAENLGEGNDMGSWKTMSGEQFMDWWK